ncbi:hypothetical protein RIF29_40853 [Crotalaria pallida]|uniref:Pectin acetylesterase n=1 Tax=Crotalaria pallida TaxID=3830 RepID=A0AAN9E5C9_CROPI
MQHQKEQGSGEGNKNWIVHMEAILSGCSAGGLTAILHCDRFKGLLPKGDTVKCLSDAGNDAVFSFINVEESDDFCIELGKSDRVDVAQVRGRDNNGKVDLIAYLLELKTM